MSDYNSMNERHEHHQILKEMSALHTATNEILRNMSEIRKDMQDIMKETREESVKRDETIFRSLEDAKKKIHEIEIVAREAKSSSALANNVFKVIGGVLALTLVGAVIRLLLTSGVT